jgi:hypothetical protein
MLKKCGRYVKFTLMSTISNCFLSSQTSDKTCEINRNSVDTRTGMNLGYLMIIYMKIFYIVLIKGSATETMIT